MWVRRKLLKDRVWRLEHALTAATATIGVMSKLMEDAQVLLQDSLPANRFFAEVLDVLEDTGAGLVDLEDGSTVSVMLVTEPLHQPDVPAGEQSINIKFTLWPWGEPDEDDPFFGDE